jgi:hypothetical protein
MAYRYKLGHYYNDSNGQYVKTSIGRLSSIARREYRDAQRVKRKRRAPIKQKKTKKSKLKIAPLYKKRRRKKLVSKAGLLSKHLNKWTNNFGNEEAHDSGSVQK